MIFLFFKVSFFENAYVKSKMFHAIQNMMSQSFFFNFYTENQSDFYLTLFHFIRLCNIIRWNQHLMLREVLNGFQHLPLGLKSIFDRCYFKFLNECNKHGWENKSSKNIIEKITLKYAFLPSLISNMHFVKPFS